MNDREKGKISIREALKKRNGALYHRLESIWEIAQELQERQRSKEGHQQGQLHCIMVEDNLVKLISDEEKEKRFSPLELFLLSAASCYHDADKSLEIKDGHGIIAMEDIFEHPEKYHLTAPEGNVLSYIIGSHSRNEVFDDAPEIYPVGNEDVHVKLLSSIFRLSDVLHTDNSRIPHIIVGDSKKEDDKTRLRKIITGWTIKNDHQIELKAVPIDSNDFNIIAKGVSMMQKEIDVVAPVLRLSRYPFEIIYSCDDRGMKRKADSENKRILLGMDYYTENEADIFRGRDNESEGLLKKVIGTNISLLIGNSGVGKTSLIRAGLFPKLKELGWKYVWTRPMNPDPIKNIINDISAKMLIGFDEPTDIVSSIMKLSEHCQSDVIIAIDQFEDILRSPSSEKEKLGKMLLRIHGKSFKNLHILLSYRGDYEAEINSFLDTSGITQPLRYPLLGLDQSVAFEVLRTIFSINHIGITDKLLNRILKELVEIPKNEKFYPPFIQIVANSLILLAKSNDGNMTEDFFDRKAGSIETIIANYLIEQLKEFGDANSRKRRNAEEILKELVRDRAKEQKGKDELLRYLKIPDYELQELLDTLVKKRLIRHLDNDNYEIIHDFLASKVEEMIKDDERPLRGARDILRTKARNYKFIPAHSLLETKEMVLLYSMKESITPDNDEKELLMRSYLAGNGPVWWWFQNEIDISRTFVESALSSRFSNVRRVGLAAFERIATHDDLPAIKEMLKDKDKDVRQAAVNTFEKIVTHDDLLAIKEMLEDKDKNIRQAAINAIVKIGTHDDLPAIKEMLKDKDKDVRQAAVKAFEKIVTYDDLLAIKEMLEDTEWDVRQAAVKAFEQIVTHDDLPAIKEMLKDTEWDVRQAAVKAFEQIVTHDDLPVIKEMLRRTDKDIRKAAINAIEKIVTHDDLPVIKEMLKNPYSDTRQAAIYAIEKLGTQDDLPAIKEMLEDTDKDVRKAAINAIVKIGTHDDFPAIKEMLKDIDKDIRQAAINAIEQIVTHDDLPAIKEMLKDIDKDIRKAAINAIVKIGTHDDLPEIKEMLKDKDIRQAAIYAIEKLGTHDDLLAIKDMLKDIDKDVRQAVINAFEKLVSHGDLPIIKKMLKDDNSDMKDLTVTVLEKFANNIQLQELVKIYASGEVSSNEFLRCIISLDEKFYFPIERNLN